MSVLALLSPLADTAVLHAFPPGKQTRLSIDEQLMQKLLAANDRQVSERLPLINEADMVFDRKAGSDFSMLAAAYCSERSTWYHHPLVIEKLEVILKILSGHQSEDGTVNMGNLESPPDTAFLVELLAAGAVILNTDPSVSLKPVKKGIRDFLLKAGQGLTTGGVHTPNHRWVICAALAQINDLYPDKKYTNRIEEWLGEGIFMDEDGHYPERSGLYAGVENTSMITMARLLNKPALFRYAEKNLALTYYYLEPDGDLITNDSRRQDQYLSKGIYAYYLHYRYMAIRNNNGRFAYIARWIESMPGFEKQVLDRSLFYFLETPLLQQEMPVAIAPEDHYEKLIKTSSLLRIRKGDISSTLFGGTDQPLQIASGRSNSPDFFAYRKGTAHLKYMRLSSAFFSMGYFYSNGIKKEGGKYVLQQELEVPYYQPLPAAKRNKQGDYKLSPSTDGRFWNKMDFANRPVSNVKKLSTVVRFSDNNSNDQLEIEVNGTDGVAVTIELCFAEGGKLTGVTETGTGDYFLKEGMGEYQTGTDIIRFGPGAFAHKKITELEGERYSTHFGTLRTTGMHVYITGITPFKHRIIFS